jgi:hypothetical protein
MAERKPNEIKIVAWLLVAKKLIKFANDETSYKVSDNVMAKSNFDKFPLNKGDKVEVGLQDGVITFLRKQKSESKSEPKGSEEAYEPTPEEEAGPTPTPTVEVPVVADINPTVPQVLTVYAIAANKKVVKFLECKDAGWFQIDPSIQAKDYNEIGLIAKTRAKVQIEENRVIFFEKMASEASQPSQDKPSEAKPQSTTASTSTPTQQTPKKEWKPTSSYQGKEDYWAEKAKLDKEHYDVKDSEKQTSIEIQSAINSACDVVGKVAASISPAPTANVINNMIESVARANFALIQELKKK